MNTSYHSEFLRHNELKLYHFNNGYLLADHNNDVLMSFVENTSSTSNSMRISIRKQPTPRFTLKVETYFGGICPLEITNFEFMDVSVLGFICRCYSESIDYKVKGNSFSECARNIQKKTGFPWEICKMMVKLKNDEEIKEAYYALNDARLYGVNQRLISMIDTSSSKREKREAFKELLGEKVYGWFELETRGNKYLDALATYLSSNYLDEFSDVAVTS